MSDPNPNQVRYRHVLRPVGMLQAMEFYQRAGAEDVTINPNALHIAWVRDAEVNARFEVERELSETVRGVCSLDFFPETEIATLDNVAVVHHSLRAPTLNATRLAAHHFGYRQVSALGPGWVRDAWLAQGSAHKSPAYAPGIFVTIETR